MKSIVKVLIENEESSKIDLIAKDNDGATGFQLAKSFGVTNVVNYLFFETHLK